MFYKNVAAVIANFSRIFYEYNRGWDFEKDDFVDLCALRICKYNTIIVCF